MSKKNRFANAFDYSDNSLFTDAQTPQQLLGPAATFKRKIEDISETQSSSAAADPTETPGWVYRNNEGQIFASTGPTQPRVVTAAQRQSSIDRNNLVMRSLEYEDRFGELKIRNWYKSWQKDQLNSHPSKIDAFETRSFYLALQQKKKLDKFNRKLQHQQGLTSYPEPPDDREAFGLFERI